MKKRAGHVIARPRPSPIHTGLGAHSGGVQPSRVKFVLDGEQTQIVEATSLRRARVGQIGTAQPTLSKSEWRQRASPLPPVSSLLQ
jgi:hypothetical protein